ncbi:hypothetical protein QJ857_gp1126 [Tupanvirus soda lake]|uniref:Uncharacterized protein n=2 Tax=Tupanvirus TaxID=2094720 RepID=A0A6N1NTJ8_9VIRU|nr:hypothetical protein QJ857_gp1126 [Tupanvirus soda lake]QKU34928.1 hypothetical protein [Tupanvirus soda lake]
MLKALKLFDFKFDLPLNGSRIAWNNLNNKIIKNEIVILEGFDDIHPHNEGPIFTANKVFLLSCDKNFVYYWLNKSTFPNASVIYLSSHPCELVVFYRNFNEICLHDHYKHYKKRWADDLENVKIITTKEINDELAKYVNEDIIFEDNKKED